MLTLTLRTDKPEAEIGLFNNGEKLLFHSWQAHRQLAETIHTTLEAVLKEKHYKLDDIEGIVFYKGPGSFTGLRIGAAVANALASQLGVPIIGAMENQWPEKAIKELGSGANDRLVIPEYGAPARTTTQKK